MPFSTALVLAGASLALGQDDDGGARVSTSFTDDFELRYYVMPDRLPDPDDVAVFNYVEQVNRLNGIVGVGAWTFTAQVDEVALFANRYYLNDELRVERALFGDGFNPWPDGFYLNPEKLKVQRDAPGWSMSFGDGYAAFGRGIALNLNRNVDIDLDTSIQGYKGVFRPGPWDLTLVLGQANRQQVFQDNPNAGIDGDRRHTVAGFRAERFGLGPGNIGAHVASYNFVSETGWGPGAEAIGTVPDTVVGGATLELTGVAGVDWYVEGDVFGFPGDEVPASSGALHDAEVDARAAARRAGRKVRQDVDGPGQGFVTARQTAYDRTLQQAAEDAQNRPGYAVYASGSFYPGKTAFLMEAKRYRDSERVNALLTPELYEVSVAPTLEYERAITEDSSAAVNSNDIWGGRVQMDWAIRPGELVPYVSVAAFRDQELGGLHFNRSRETIVHGMTGVEWILEDGAALVNAGLRRDHRDDADHGHDQQIHGDASIKFPVPAGLHAEIQVAVERYHWGTNAFQQDDYLEIESGVTLQKGSDVAVTWFTDFSDNPLVDSVGNLTDTLYGAVEVQVKPSSAVTLKAFYGAYKAGIRCSGGQCRLLPGFEGTRFSVVASF